MLLALLIAFAPMTLGCQEKPEEPDTPDVVVDEEFAPEKIIAAYTPFVTAVTSHMSRELTKSVTAYQVEFETMLTKPIRMDLFTVDMTDPSITLEATYPSEFTTENWPVRNMKEQADAIDAPGHKVIGAVNADFFDIGVTGWPDGAVIHNGEIIKEFCKEPSNTVYFGITKDGKVSMGGYTAFLGCKGNLYEAVCGRTELIKNGKALENGDASLAPRTAIGANEDGTIVYIAVFDERESNSPRNGITYRAMAECLKRLGCYNAVNLDGGGSSTFLVRTGDDYEVWNKQPGATLRKVADGLAIIQK